MTESTTATPAALDANRTSWRRQRAEELRWWQTHNFRRFLWLAGFLGLLGLFSWLVFAPTLHQQSHLVFLSGSDYRVLRAPPVAFALEDFNGLQPLAKSLALNPDDPEPRPLGNLSSPAALEGLGSVLVDLVSGDRDSLIVYVSAHGVVVDGQPWLLCRNFDPANPSVGRSRVVDLLTAVQRSPAANKCLILDAGRLPDDGRLGQIANGFPRLLQQTVQDFNDRSIWVLSANSPLEHSHVSQSLRRSVFGYFVARGLKGAADLNANQEVDVDELARYVSVNVSAWVNASTQGTESQTPLLFWGGGATVPRDLKPTLISVSALSKAAREEDEIETAVAARQRPRNPNFPPGKAQSDDEVKREAALRAKRVRLPLPKPLFKAGVFVAKTTPKKKPSDKTASASEAAAETSSAAGPAADSASDKRPTQPGDAKPGGDKTVTAAAQPVETPRSAGELLAEAWQLRDQWADRAATGQTTPIDFSPHVWRQYEAWLLSVEARYRAGAIVDESTLTRQLREAVRDLRKQLDGASVKPAGLTQTATESPATIAGDATSAGGKSASFAARLAAVAPGNFDAIDQPQTLAMAQYLADRGGPPLTPALQATIAQLDQVIGSGTPADFANWSGKLQPADDQWLELRLARRLAKLPAIDWPLLQQTLAVSRVAEQTATADGWSLRWVDDRILDADHWRLAGERAITDQIDPDREAQAGRWLRQADDEYRAAAADLQVVQTAAYLHEESLNRAADYLAWYAAGPSDGAVAPRAADLLQFYEALQHLATIFDAADISPPQLAELRQWRDELRRLRQRLDAPLMPGGLAALEDGQVILGNVHRAEILLSTALPRAGVRSELLGIAGSIDEKLIVRFRPAKIPLTIPAARPTSTQDWQLVAQRAELEMALARLQHSNSLPATDALTRLQTAYDQLAQANRQRESRPGNDDPMWQASQQFGTALMDFQAALPREINRLVEQNSDLSNPLQRPAALVALRLAQRQLRLIDPRDVKPVERLSPQALIAQANWYDLLSLRHRRWLLAMQAAPTADVSFLATAAANDRLAVTRLTSQPTLREPPTPQLSFAGPTALSLDARPDVDVSLRLVGNGLTDHNAWIVLHYDPRLIEMLPSPGATLYMQHQYAAASRLRESAAQTAVGPASDAATAAGDRPTSEVKVGAPDWQNYTPRPDLDNLPATMMLPESAPGEINFTVRANRTARGLAHVVVMAIADGQQLRHEIDVQLAALDSVDLLVNGTPGSFTRGTDNRGLLPFANRSTQYTLTLVNAGGLPKTVDLQLLAAGRPYSQPLPMSAIEPAEATKLLAAFGANVPLVAADKITVPADGVAEIPFPKIGLPVIIEKLSADVAEKGKPGATPAKVEEAVVGLPKISLDSGLLAVITDRETGRKTIRRYDLTPQKPRRFVQVRAGYSVDRQQIEIHVSAQDPALIPPGGVKVSAQLPGETTTGATSQLGGLIQSPDFETSLFAKFAAEAGRVVRVDLNIDGYPRAFVYRINCGTAASDLPEEADLREVRVLAPAVGTAYKAPIGSIPVEFQVDSPIDAFHDASDVVEIGVDVDRDRDLRGEPSVKFHSDRQANVDWRGANPDGSIAVDAHVGDFKLDLPAPGLQNARVAILGKLTARGKSAWSLPHEIILDGTPAKVDRVQILPSPLIEGDKPSAIVVASDGELSGAGKVEVAIDLARSGKFDDPPNAPLVAKQEPDGSWLVKLTPDEIKLGENHLLVRVTDKVGNVGPHSDIPFKMFTKEQASIQGVAKTSRIFGTVMNGVNPVPKITVTLEAPPVPPAAPGADSKTTPPPPKFAPVTTDDRGDFTFNNVPPGKYKLSAGGLLHNKNRKADQDVVVEPPPAVSKSVKLLLK